MSSDQSTDSTPDSTSGEFDGEGIPVIDISAALQGRDLDVTAAAIDSAARTVGFFQLTGHGVSSDLLEAAYTAMHALAALSESDRELLAAQSPHPFRGLHLNRDASGRVRQQRFHAGRFDTPEAAVAAGVPEALADYYHPNVWPDGLPDFDVAVRGLFDAMTDVAALVMRLAGVAFGAEAQAFDAVLEPHASSFAINQYPASGEDVDGPPPVVFDAHADGNTITVLHQRGDYVGLQVQQLATDGTEERWIGIPVRDDAFVINVGQLMHRFTNGQWPATRHRVVAAPDAVSSRMSLTTFHMPALDAVVAPIPESCAPDGPRFEPITPYEADRQLMLRRYRSATATTHYSDEVYQYVASLEGAE